MSCTCGEIYIEREVFRNGVIDMHPVPKRTINCPEHGPRCVVCGEVGLHFHKFSAQGVLHERH